MVFYETHLCSFVCFLKALTGSDRFQRRLIRERTATMTSARRWGGCKAQLEELAQHHKLCSTVPGGRSANGMGSGELVATATVVYFQLFGVGNPTLPQGRSRSYVAQIMF